MRGRKGNRRYGGETLRGMKAGKTLRMIAGCREIAVFPAQELLPTLSEEFTPVLQKITHSAVGRATIRTKYSVVRVSGKALNGA